MNFYPLGLGTNRFDTSTVEARAAAVELCKEAFNLGVNYVDVAPTYSRGFAETIVGKAIRHYTATGGTAPAVTLKITSAVKTSAAAIDAANRSLDNMQLTSAEWFVCWGIKSFDEFKQIIKTDGVYDSAIMLKASGKIHRISASLHAPPEQCIEILESGMFEAVTLSVNVLNYAIMKPVLHRAGQLGIPVIVMNPLAGGVIPQTSEFFSFLPQIEGESVSAAAIKYLLAHDEIQCVLSGASSIDELHENIAATQNLTPPSPQVRIAGVESSFACIDGICTGCHYCDGCPQGIDVFRFMQAYNTLQFPQPEMLYNMTDKRVLENIQICSLLSKTFQFLPHTAENPCISCGQCERKCTAGLPVIKRLVDLYERFKECGYSRHDQLKRIRTLIGDASKVALYPAGGYTTYVIELMCEEYIDKMPELLLYDSNEKLHGSFNSGIEIRAPGELPVALPDILIISNYIYGQEIYNQIEHLQKDGIAVKKLHQANDVPWVF